MNVDPVQASVAGIERQTPEKKLQAILLPQSAVSGNAPKPEIAETQNSPLPIVISGT